MSIDTTVAIACYNGEQFLHKLIYLSSHEPCKVIAVDDNSIDRAWQILGQYEFVRKLRNNENKGFAEVNNLGASLASTGGYCVVARRGRTRFLWKQRSAVPRRQKDQRGRPGDGHDSSRSRKRGDCSWRLGNLFGHEEARRFAGRSRGSSEHGPPGRKRHDGDVAVHPVPTITILGR